MSNNVAVENQAAGPPAPARADPVLDRLDSRRNNFDAIRLIAALLVMFSHQLFFVGRAQPLFAGYSLGEIAVMMFFVISGYLVAESWYRDPHLVRFLLRRFLRIWPALAVATLVIAGFAAAVSNLPWRDYFSHPTWHFIARNLQLRIVYDLPGVFTDASAPAMAAVNGSWWSIPLEVKCYLYITVLGLIGLRRRWVSLLALAAVAVLCARTLPGHPRANALHHLKYLCTAFFVTGLCARQFIDVLLHHRIASLGVGVALLVAALVAGQHDLLVWVVLAPLVLVAGSMSTPWLRSAGRFGDLSYGLYIYAYFVQQLSVRYWPGGGTYWGSVLVSIAVTAGLAWCSWHAIEAPALGLKRHLRRWFSDGAA